MAMQNLCTKFDLITAHTPISTQSSCYMVFRLQSVHFYPFFYKSICCGYLFELPQQVEAIQISSNNICFYEDQKKVSHK